MAGDCPDVASSLVKEYGSDRINSRFSSQIPFQRFIWLGESLRAKFEGFSSFLSQFADDLQRAGCKPCSKKWPASLRNLDSTVAPS